MRYLLHCPVEAGYMNKILLLIYQLAGIKMNEFQMYEQLRAYQLHCERLQSQDPGVPKHEAYSPSIPNLDRAKQYHKLKKSSQIEFENGIIMQKLVNINQRKHSMSSPNLRLPPIKKNDFHIPLYEDSNNQIAKKIITSKPSISVDKQLRNYRTLEQHRRRISKYETAGPGVSVNKKKYIAELLLLKKLKGSRIINPEL